MELIVRLPGLVIRKIGLLRDQKPKQEMVSVLIISKVLKWYYLFIPVFSVLI
jgi:hypothetical protein